MSQVEWRPFFDGVFEASSDGRIRRAVKTRPNQKLGEVKASPNGKYLRCCLRLNGKARSFSVHVLILLAFRGPRPAGYQSAHLNGNGMDNRIDNLQYKTPIENERDKLLHDTRVYGERQGSHKLTEADVRTIRIQLATGAASINGIARARGLDPMTIWNVKHRRTWAHVK